MDALNGHGDHPYYPLVIGLPLEQRLAIAGSLCSGKKLLPECCPGMVLGIAKKHAEVMSTPLSVSESYLVHCRRMIRRMFVKGWDSHYKRDVEFVTPSLSAAIDHPRSKGGVMSCHYDRQEYVDAVTLEHPEYDFPTTCEFRVVNAEGKPRGITVTHGDHMRLKPLHNTLYNYLSRFGWLLRGDANKQKLREFTFKEGEVIVSGDYESATDGLSLDVSKVILSEILDKCDHVPESVRRWALSSLTSTIMYDGESVEQKRGQLMGNLLSFPLLCLQNYLAFKFLVSRKVPVKINGDDIVWRGTRSEYKTWLEGLAPLGLKLSAGKTFVHNRFISINSTYFLACRLRVKTLGVLRLGMLRKPDSVGELGRSHNRFISSFLGAEKERASVTFLRTHTGSLKKSGRSLLAQYPIGLGARIPSISCLQEVRLLVREAWYAQNFVPRRPIPTPYKIHNLPGLPEGWVRSGTRMSKGKRKLLRGMATEAMVAAKWSVEVQMYEQRKKEYLEELDKFGGEGFRLAWRDSRIPGSAHFGENCAGVWSPARGGFVPDSPSKTQYARQLRLLRGCGYKKGMKHPMRIRLCFVIDLMKKPQFRRPDYGLRPRESVRFVLSSSGAGAVPSSFGGSASEGPV